MGLITVKKSYSPAAAGLQRTLISFGTGHFKIHSLGVYYGGASAGAGLPAQSIHVYMRYFEGDVPDADVILGSGWYSNHQMYSIHNIEFNGPALLLAYSFHLDIVQHDLVVQYERLVS